MGGVVVSGATVGSATCFFSLLKGVDDLYPEEEAQKIVEHLSEFDPNEVCMARRENYEYYGHFWKLRNKIDKRLKEDVLNGVEPEEVNLSTPLFLADGSLNNLSGKQRGMMFVSVAGLIATLRMIK